MKKVPHDWNQSHNIDGAGVVTQCPETCRAHCRWQDENDHERQLGLEPLGDETWGSTGHVGDEAGLKAAVEQHGLGQTTTLKPYKPEPIPPEDIWRVMFSEPAPEFSARASVLNEARDLITGDRNAQYGPPTQDFQRTADLLSVLGFRFADFNTASGKPVARDLLPSDIALIMISLKMSRIIQSRNKRDSWVDLAGYAGCGYECTIEEK